MSKEKKHWDCLNRKKLLNTRIFDIYEEESLSPRTGKSIKFNVIECHCSWVNIVAVTKENEIVMVNQYRHGSKAVELETPGGCIEKDEDPINAAIRELREETGYSGKNASIIGKVSPNPAIQGNFCYIVLIDNAVKTHDTEMDEGEDLDTLLVPYCKVKEKVLCGEIRHGIVLNALYFYELNNEMNLNRN